MNESFTSARLASLAAMSPNALLIVIAGSVLPPLVVSLVATYVVRGWAASLGLIDLPGERKVHATPTPRGGGLAIWLGVVGTFAAGQLALWYVTRTSGGEAIVPAFARE